MLDDLWQCVVFVLNRVAWVGYPSKVIWHPVVVTFLVNTFSIVLIERQSSYLLFQKKKCQFLRAWMDWDNLQSPT